MRHTVSTFDICVEQSGQSIAADIVQANAILESLSGTALPLPLTGYYNLCGDLLLMGHELMHMDDHTPQWQDNQ